MKSNKQIEKFISQIEDAKIYLEELQSSKQDSFDNKSEKWQEGERGEEAQQEINYLEELAGECESLIGSFNNLFEAD
jgi:hypothetical protein